MRRLRDPVFLGLAFCFAAHAFIGTGLGAHLVLLLRERGWPEATVLLLAAAHAQPVQARWQRAAIQGQCLGST
jgi:hypothetical protein